MLASQRISSKPFTARSGTPRVGSCLHSVTRDVRTKAYVEASVAYAVTQQAIAYIAVLGGDLYWERNSKSAPDMKIVGAGAGATLAAVGIVNTGISALTGIGMVVGLLAAGAMTTYHGKRTMEIGEDPDADFPGPKALPATITVISFFALNVFLQGIRAEL